MKILDDTFLISRMSYGLFGFSEYIRFMYMSMVTIKYHNRYILEDWITDVRYDLVRALPDSRWK